MPYTRVPRVRPISIADFTDEPISDVAITYDVVDVHDPRRVDTLAYRQRVSPDTAADDEVNRYINERSLRALGESLMEAVAERGPAIVGRLRRDERVDYDTLAVDKIARVNVFFLTGATEEDWNKWREVER